MDNNYKFDILFTANKKYIDIMLASIYSLLLNSNLPSVRLHIICEGFDKEDYERVESIIKQFKSVEVYFYPLENYNISKYNIPDWHGTQIANARLFFGDIIKPYILNIENLLYLDSDTITVGTLSDLTQYQNGLHAVKDSCLHHYYKSLNNLSSYYNSGVLYFDVKEWMNNDYQSKLLQALKDSNVELSYPDQDILNYTIGNEINELPVKYNIPPHAYLFKGKLKKIYFNPSFRNISHQEIDEATNDPRIIHTYGLTGIKPWQTPFNPFFNEYMKYIRQINPDFQVEELDRFKKVLIMAPHLYQALLIARTYMSESIEKKVRTLALKCHNYKKP